MAPVIAPPEDRIGEFQVTLAPPDYQDRESIQRHWAFSMMWTILLRNEIASRSYGSCSGFVTASRFPHLYLFLSHGAALARLDAPSCVRLVQKAVAQSRPDARAIERSRAEARWTLADRLRTPTSQPLLTAGLIVEHALPQIYRAGTVLHALASTGPEVFQSVDGDAFAAWLERQRSTGSVALAPIRLCPSGDADRESSPTAFAETAALPHSGTVPPGLVILSRWVPRPPEGDLLKYLVAVGTWGPVHGPKIGSATAKYCKREHVFPGERGVAKLRIECLSNLYFNAASWTVFYCASPECASEPVVRSAMEAIAHDPDVAGSAGWDPESGERQGPYIINVRSAPE